MEKWKQPCNNQDVDLSGSCSYLQHPTKQSQSAVLLICRAKTVAQSDKRTRQSAGLLDLEPQRKSLASPRATFASTETEELSHSSLSSVAPGSTWPEMLTGTPESCLAQQCSSKETGRKRWLSEEQSQWHCSAREHGEQASFSQVHKKKPFRLQPNNEYRSNTHYQKSWPKTPGGMLRASPRHRER